MVKHLLLMTAAALLPLSTSQAQQPPKPVSRADYLKSVDVRFNNMDTNHDGKVTKDELGAELQRELQQASAGIGRQLEAKFHQLDTNKDGQLSLREFMAAAPALHANESPDQMLQQLDANHDGKITVDEFRSPEIAKFNRLDANHDGVVTPAEIQAASVRK